MVVVEGDTERLFCFGREVAGFDQTVYDPTTGCLMAERPASFAEGLLATFPAIEGVSTIIVSPPAVVDMSPENWVAVLVHEHFHQVQNTYPNYFQQVLALDLHDGDQTGMWMLNYPFAYDDPAVGAAFEAAIGALKDAVAARGQRAFPSAVARYLEAREAFAASVSARDWRYFEFQLWQEGVARWVEMQAAIIWDGHPATAESAVEALVAELERLDLERDQRVAVYAFGAGETLLIDAAFEQDDWTGAYWWGSGFALGPVLQAAADRL